MRNNRRRSEKVIIKTARFSLHFLAWRNGKKKIEKRKTSHGSDEATDKPMRKRYGEPEAGGYDEANADLKWKKKKQSKGNQ